MPLSYNHCHNHVGPSGHKEPPGLSSLNSLQTLPLHTSNAMQYGSNFIAFLSLLYTPFTTRAPINCILGCPFDRPTSAHVATLQSFLSITDQPLQLGCTAITGSWWDCSWPFTLTKGITTGGFFLLWQLYRCPGKCHFSS